MLKAFFTYALALMTLTFAFNAQAQDVQALLRQANNPVAGNPKGQVTIVEFFDYQCSYCLTMAAVIDNIIRSHKDVRIVFKDYPIRGELSKFASRAALAAHLQGKYYQFNHALLTANQPLTTHFIYTTAEKIGLNVARLKRDMDSAKVKTILNNNIQVGESFGVSGTPSFFIANSNASDDKNIIFNAGSMSTSDLEQAINQVK